MKYRLVPRQWIVGLLLALGIGLQFSACKPPEEDAATAEIQRPGAEEPAGGTSTTAPTDREVDHDHHHAAPHGGTLLAMGDHLGHIEVLLDPASGRLTLYALDGHAENPVRMTEPSLALTVTPEGGRPIELQVAAQENALTGETPGDTSQFTVTDERLKNLQRFQGRIGRMSFRGTSITGTEFKFPDGNE